MHVISFLLILQVTGKCGSVTVRLIPAPRGTGIVSAPVPKKLLNMAGIEDCYTSARGCTATLGNFGKSLFPHSLTLILPNKLSLPDPSLTVNQSDNPLLFIHKNSQTE